LVARVSALQQVQQTQQGTAVFSATPLLLGMCCSLSIISAIQDLVPATYMHAFVPSIVKMLNRCAREMAVVHNGVATGQQHQQHHVQVAAARR
jgi:hypothetical protein